MSALPCPVADPFAAADQAYATITQFLRSQQARQVKHSEPETLSSYLWDTTLGHDSFRKHAGDDRIPDGIRMNVRSEGRGRAHPSPLQS